MNRYFKLAAITTLGLAIAGCSTGGKSEKSAPAIENLSIGVQGYEFGPAVQKVIVELGQSVDKIDGSKIKVSTADVKREVQNVYLSDKSGRKTSKASKYVTVELTVDYSDKTFSGVASPFTFNMTTFMNEWSAKYDVKVDNLLVGDASLSKKADAINNRVIPEVAKFNVTDSFSGSYQNPLTDKKEDITIHYAAYQPEKLDGEAKNPLIIWLNGQGEGGTDTSIELLGNEVTALARKDIQNQFTAGDQTGAYVLAVQSPTYWMDEGDGTNGSGAGVSRYTEALMDTIKAYVASNPDVDTDRIYLSGCSNGGYMTLNMAVHYPDYFAALVPNAAAYSYYNFERNDDGTYKKVKNDETGAEESVPQTSLWFDQDKLDTVKDIPMWFVHSADDTTVIPQNYALPIYKALVDAGAGNKWFSYYESVNGTDIKGAQYLGHWSWIYYFNNQVSGVQNVEAIRKATGTDGFKPSNASQGGEAKAEVEGKTFNTVFEWLNAQSK